MLRKRLQMSALSQLAGFSSETRVKFVPKWENLAARGMALSYDPEKQTVDLLTCVRREATLTR
jgi:hypothetical protein